MCSLKVLPLEITIIDGRIYVHIYFVKGCWRSFVGLW